jgi:CheY-like chemotaxis protein
MAKVMIVEDEFLIRLTLAEALADDGFEVLEAADANEALALLGETPDISLLLTDIQLPGGRDGVALARAVRERSPDIPVLYMTGRPDSISRGATAPGDGFIAKPYLPSEVCVTARRLIEKSKS